MGLPLCLLSALVRARPTRMLHDTPVSYALACPQRAEHCNSALVCLLEQSFAAPTTSIFGYVARVCCAIPVGEQMC